MKVNYISNANRTNQYTQTKSRNISLDDKPQTHVLNLNNSPNFKGLFSFFCKEAKSIPLESAQEMVLSEKQLYSVKKAVVKEIAAILHGPATEPITERLDKLLNSPFADYSLSCLGETGSVSLRNMVSMPKNENPKLYSQFLLTSLSKTMPIEEYKGSKDVTNLYHNNEYLYDILKSYTNIDENSVKAKSIRTMIPRLLESKVDIQDLPSFFADYLLAGKTKICKLLEKELNLKPNTEIPVLNSFFMNKEIFLNKCKRVKSVSTIFNTYEDPSAVVHMQKYKWALNSPDNECRIFYKTLYNIAGASQNPETRNFFDIADFLFGQCKEGYSSWFTGTAEKNRAFLQMHINTHPELKSLEFYEKLASKYNAQSRLNIKSTADTGLTLDFWKSEEAHKQAGVILEKLKNSSEISHEIQRRIKNLEDIYYLTGEAIRKDI